MKRSLSLSKKIGLSLFVVGGLLFASQLYNVPRGSDLTSVSVTMANPRLSFAGRLGTVTTATTNVVIDTGAAYSSKNTNQLQEGDSIRIGAGGAMGLYTVKSTTPATDFTTTAAVTMAAGNHAIATQSGQISVRFITASAQPNGKLRVLIPAVATTGADGIPDPNTFDYGTGASVATATCPTTGGNYTFGAAALASMQNIGGTYYHTITCAYTGTGTAGADFTANPILINNMINPSPQITPTLHVAGTADTYKIIVEQLSSTDVVMDSTAVSVGVIEAVKVSADVAPQITFSIAGIASGQTPCTGVTTGVTTTAVDVPFGELAINTFRYAAQKLSVSTNANSGYAVTAIANDQLGYGGGICTGDAVIGSNTLCIQDSRGDDAAMTHTAHDDWSSTGNSGFAYTLTSATGSPVLPFTSATSGGACGGGNDCFRQFADNENVGIDATQVPQTIMSYGDVTNTQEANVCYGINVGATQTAGSYENYITYRATATF